MTTQEILKSGGTYPLRNGLRIWSEEAFRKEFLVGDLIMGWSGRVVGRITAIGEKRFLYRVTKPWEQVEERVGTMRSATGWGFVEGRTK